MFQQESKAIRVVMAVVMNVVMVIVLGACSDTSNNASSEDTAVPGANTESSQNLQDTQTDSQNEPGDTTTSSTNSASEELSYESLSNSYSYRVETNDSSDNWLVFVHGGSWYTGDKNDALFYLSRGIEANALLDKFNVASLEYELWDKDLGTGTHLEQTTNVADFLRTVKTADNKVCLMGHSAGGNIAASVAIRFPELVDCFIGIGGVYDISAEGMQYDAMAVQLLEILYQEQSPIEVSPAEMLTPSYAIDTLLLHSINDPIVSYQHAVNFASQIEQETQADVTLVLDDELYPFVAHNIPYFAGADFLYPDRMALLDFIDEQLTN